MNLTPSHVLAGGGPRLFCALIVAVSMAAACRQQDDATLARHKDERAVQVDATAEPRKVIFVGLDGADWQHLRPLVEQGLMPNLNRLLNEGASGVLTSESPTLSPLLWTTMFTGTSPLKHRILDFTRFHPQSGAQEPITSTERRVPAIWNMADAAGLTTGVFGLWATYPPEAIKGQVVSDRALSFFHSEAAMPADAVSPPELRSQVVNTVKRVEGDVDAAYLRRFLPDLTADEYGRSFDVKSPYQDPVAALRRIVVETLVYHRLAVEFLHNQEPDLTLVYLQGTDTIGHTFAAYVEPRLPGVSAADSARFRDVPRRYFAFVDELLGDYLSSAKEGDGVLFLASDHGFEWGESRPTTVASGARDTAAYWHRLDGIYLLWGAGIQPFTSPARLRQVAATLLDLLGLPPGKGVAEPSILSPRTERLEPVDYAAYYRPPPEPTANDDTAQAQVEQLRALGYLADSHDAAPQPGSTRTAGSYNNEGLILKNLGRKREAVQALRKAASLDPQRPAVFSNLGVLASELGEHHRAIEYFDRARQLTPGSAEGYLNLAAALVRAGRWEQAKEEYRHCVQQLPSEAIAGRQECGRLLAAAEAMEGPPAPSASR